MKIKLLPEKMTKTASGRPVVKYRFLTFYFKIDFIKAAPSGGLTLVYVRISTSSLGVRYLSKEGFETIDEAFRIVTTEGVTVLSDAESLVDQFLELGLIEQVEDGLESAKKELGYLARKANRLKTRKFPEDSFGAFEALESLALGILGKEALWTALAALDADAKRERDPSLSDSR